ncbi:hypothetical protein ABZ543_08290 [Streptomyces roseifaciens]
MFRLTVTPTDGASEGPASEAYARHLLRRATRRGYRIEATVRGGAEITWTARTLTRRRTEDRSITLVPTAASGICLTTANLRHLNLVNRGQGRYEPDGTDGERAITGPAWQIPPAATAQLIACGLVTDDDGLVRLTLTAQLALLARRHRTYTHTHGPVTWPRPDDRPGTMVCQCGHQLRCASRDEARQRAAEHRATVTTAAVTALCAAYA